MSDDSQINELKAQVEMLKSNLLECMTAFQDALGVLFAETNDHAKCHAQEQGLEGEELADKMAQLINHEGQFLQQSFSEGASPHAIIHSVAEWLGHTPLPSEFMGYQPGSVEVGAFAVKDGQSVTDALKEQLESGNLPPEMADAVRAMLDSGTTDQLDAQLRDMRKKDQANLN